jgi:hypothetical protein
MEEFRTKNRGRKRNRGKILKINRRSRRVEQRWSKNKREKGVRNKGKKKQGKTKSGGK